MSSVTKIIVSSIALILAIVHFIYPELTIDTTTLVLLVLAAVPWLGTQFKSFELPGGFKFEFRDLERVERQAQRAGLIKKGIPNYSRFSLPEITNHDPVLALAWLRIELEKLLKKLARSKGLELDRKTIPLSALIEDLSNMNILTKQEKSVLADMINVLNKAVHGENLDRRVVEWVKLVGPEFLDGINEKISQ